MPDKNEQPSTLSQELQEQLDKLNQLNEGLEGDKKTLNEKKAKLGQAVETATINARKVEELEKSTNAVNRSVLLFQMRERSDTKGARAIMIDDVNPAFIILKEARIQHPDDVRLRDCNDLYNRFSQLYSENLENNNFPTDSQKQERIADAIIGMRQVLRLSQVYVNQIASSKVEKSNVANAGAVSDVWQKAERVLPLGASEGDIAKNIVPSDPAFAQWKTQMNARAASAIDVAIKKVTPAAKQFPDDATLQSIAAFCDPLAGKRYAVTLEGEGDFRRFKRDAKLMAQAEHVIGWLEIGIRDFNAHVALNPKVQAFLKGEKPPADTPSTPPAKPEPLIVSKPVAPKSVDTLPATPKSASVAVPASKPAEAPVTDTKKIPTATEKKVVATLTPDIPEIKNFVSQTERAKTIHETFKIVYATIQKKYPGDTLLTNELMKNWSAFIESNATGAQKPSGSPLKGVFSGLLNSVEQNVSATYLENTYSPKMTPENIRAQVVRDSGMQQFPILNARQYEAVLWLSVHGEEVLGTEGITNKTLGMNPKFKPVVSADVINTLVGHLEALNDISESENMKKIRELSLASIGTFPKQKEEVKAFRWMMAAQNEAEPRKGLPNGVEVTVTPLDIREVGVQTYKIRTAKNISIALADWHLEPDYTRKENQDGRVTYATYDVSEKSDPIEDEYVSAKFDAKSGTWTVRVKKQDIQDHYLLVKRDDTDLQPQRIDAFKVAEPKVMPAETPVVKDAEIPNAAKVKQTDVIEPKIVTNPEVQNPKTEWQNMARYGFSLLNQIYQSNGYNKQKANSPDVVAFMAKMKTYREAYMVNVQNPPSDIEMKKFVYEWAYWINVYAVRFEELDRMQVPDWQKIAVTTFERMEKIRQSAEFAEEKKRETPLYNDFKNTLNAFIERYESKSVAQDIEGMKADVESFSAVVTKFEVAFKMKVDPVAAVPVLVNELFPEKVSEVVRQKESVIAAVTDAKTIEKAPDAVKEPEWYEEARTVIALHDSMKKSVQFEYQKRNNSEVFKAFQEKDGVFLSAYANAVKSRMDTKGMQMLLGQWNTMLVRYERVFALSSKPTALSEAEAKIGELKDIDSEDTFFRFLRSGQPVLVEFGATWCEPCKQMRPDMEELSKSGLVLSVDIDEMDGLAADYATSESVPVTILFVHGQEVERKGGRQQKAELSAMQALGKKQIEASAR
jgi:thioredoxin 1